MADARGENWALPTQTAGGTAFRRPIRVSITADRIVVHGNSTERRRDRTFIFDPTVSSAMDPMVEAIWERIDSWGVAGFNSYWKPELNVQVYPGGETSFQEMKQLLKDSGLGVSEVSP